jgi:mono/diheme cytochrome c family protein
LPELCSVAVRSIVVMGAAACVVIAAGAQDARKLPAAAASYDFARDIQPILEANCVRCHGAAKRRSGLRLDTREQLLKGGSEHEQVIIEGQSARSPLVLMAAGLVQDLEMPPKDEGARLTGQQIGLLRAWIDDGAKWPEGVQLVSTATATDMEATRKIVSSLPPPAARTIDFVSDIQPLFRKSCYECHGAQKQEGGLRFDHKGTALGAGDSGVVIVPGKSADSPLIRLVATPGDKGMPRKGPRLTAEQIATLRAWIDQGAQWPDAASVVLANRTEHWAFKGPRRPPLPTVGTRAWVKTPIDAFVLARLEKEGLSPSPEADKATLLRRLSLDLTGLPPTLQELDAFLTDTSPDAYTRQVERLLASPHYGERWARHWLDAARYADSDGFEKDKPRSAWAYRDWVIGALNTDLPYDRFIVEQIAGDQLPNAAQGQVVATGYLRNSMINEEGGVDPEQFRMEAMFDRMEAIGKGVLGLTIQCAQCHDHKFDPIRQEEYYRLFAFLNNDNEGSVPVYSPADLMKLSEQRRLTGEIEANLRHRTPDWSEQMTKWEVAAKASEPQWTVVKPEVEDISTGGQRYLPQPDGSLLAQGYAPTKHEVKLTATLHAPRITAFRIELLTDANLPLGGP